MFPTLHPGDLVVVAILVGKVLGNGELELVQVEGEPASFLIPRVGKQSNRRIKLVCDNALRYPLAYLARERVRGRVVRAVRQFTAEEAERTAAAAVAQAKQIPVGEWVPAEDVFGPSGLG